MNRRSFFTRFAGFAALVGVAKSLPVESLEPTIYLNHGGYTIPDFHPVVIEQWHPIPSYTNLEEQRAKCLEELKRDRRFIKIISA